MDAPPRFLFVPVSTPAGAGEYYRSLACARGLQRRWPNALIHFIVNRHAPYAGEVPFPVTRLDGSPTHRVKEVVQVIRDARPHIAFFIDAGRVGQFRAARSAGGRVVYLSSRAKTRWKGFRLRRLWAMDEHWIAGPRFIAGHLSWRERCKRWFAPRVQVRFFDTMFEPVDEAASAARLAALGLERGEYLLFCPGGAGRFPGLPDAPRIYLEAAQALAARCGRRALVVTGAAMTRQSGADASVHTVAAVPNGELMGLLRTARLAIVNGGDLLVQALVQGAVCVAAPIAGDQPPRIRACARRGLVRAAQLSAESLCANAEALLRDPSAYAALAAAVRGADLRDGVPDAVRACEELLLRRS